MAQTLGKGAKTHPRTFSASLVILVKPRIAQCETDPHTWAVAKVIPG